MASIIEACKNELARRQIAAPIPDSLLRSEAFAAFVGGGLTRALDSLLLRDSVRVLVDTNRIELLHTGPAYPYPWDMEQRWGMFWEQRDKDEHLMKAIVDSLFASRIGIEVTHFNEWRIEEGPQVIDQTAVELMAAAMGKKLIVGIPMPTLLSVEVVQPKSKSIAKAASVPTWQCVRSTLSSLESNVVSDTHLRETFSITIQTEDERIGSYFSQSWFVVEMTDAYPDDPVYAGRFAKVSVVRKHRMGTTLGGWLKVIETDEFGPRVKSLLLKLKAGILNCEPPKP